MCIFIFVSDHFNYYSYMETINKNLYGYWKMTGMRFRDESGSWNEETVIGGDSIITESGNINTYTRTSETDFGYSGKFKVKGDELIIALDVCTVPELEGKTIKRSVKELTSDSLTLGLLDDATGRSYEVDLKLVTRNFSG
jgi:hypothetical protein